MRKTLLNEMYAWCCGRPQCACHQFSQINTLINGPWTGTGVAQLAGQRPASTIGDCAYWQWRVLAWTKGEFNEIWACVYDKWEAQHCSALMGTWAGFCSIVALLWRNGVGVGRPLTANRVIVELYWNLLESSAIAVALTTQVKAAQPRAIPLHSLFSVSADHLTELSWKSESNLVTNTACLLYLL